MKEGEQRSANDPKTEKHLKMQLFEGIVIQMSRLQQFLRILFHWSKLNNDSLTKIKYIITKTGLYIV